jgi:PST family polysaccharide transporter
VTTVDPTLPAPASGAAVPGARELDRSLVRGIAWTGGMRWATQLLAWASTLVVARLLAPSDYGLVGMAMVYIGLVQLVNEFGIGVAIVQRRGLTEEQVARLGGLALLVGGGFVTVSIAASSLVARAFGEPAVRAIVVVSSLTFLTGALQVVPRALLARDLDFRRVAWADGVEALVTTAVTLTLAALGAGYWALVLGPLAGRSTSACLLNIWRAHRLAWPFPFGTIAGAVTFGWQVVVASVAWYLYNNADFAVVGRVLGAAALGAYTLGWNVAGIPVERVSALLGAVTPAVFSAVQHDQSALQRYLRSLTQGLSLVTFPAAVGIALTADQFVLAVLGARWRPAILPLQLLALSAALRSVSTLLPQVAVATGHARRNMQLTILVALILPGLFWAGTHWGTGGVAAAWLVGHPTLAMPLYLFHALAITRLAFRDYLRSLAPAAGATLVMAAGVLGLRWMLPASWPGPVQLGCEIALGVGIYGAVLYGTSGTRVRALWAMFRDLRSQSGEAPSRL